MAYSSGSLLTLEQDGAVPECRMTDARATQNFVRRMIDNDVKRSYKRSRVNGLVDGNPPYKQSKLREAGRAEACNVNWGTGRSYLESGQGAFYDLATEAPSMITFRTAFGTPEQREQWSNLAAKEADRVLATEDDWDYDEQISQFDMVLHGCGPMFFEGPFNVLPRAVQSGDLKVPEFTRSTTKRWEVCMLQVSYNPAELYAFIKDEGAAKTLGWRPSYVKRVIANAMDIKQQAGIQYEWEYFQQELKNNSLSYYDDSKVCQLAFVFWKEFDGRITQAIVERNTSDGLETQYLFISPNKYESFEECVHPMYFDHGNGGYHHSVTGLGVKMYSAMEYQNRLYCNLCDKAFAPKILFRPTTTEATQKFSLAHMGDYAVMPRGFETQQGAVAGLMDDGLAMMGQLNQVMQNVLSSYRSPALSPKQGNPVTKFEKQLEAAMQSALSKTQFNRYYKQRDALISEIWRRLTLKDTTDERAKLFQKRCKDQGIDPKALTDIEYVGATRVVGQGSAFMRKQAIDALFPMAGSLPEDGRDNLLADKIAAEAGQAAVARYYPKRDANDKTSSDQQAEALLWVSAMKTGIPPVVTSTQNPLTYAATFLKAATDSLKSLQAGADMMEVYQFLNIAGPAIVQQLQRFQNDPTRKPVFDQMLEQWQQLAKITDQLKNKIQQDQAAKNGQQQATQTALTDEQIKSQKAQNDIQLKSVKTAAQLKQSDEKHQQKMEQGRQNLVLADAKTATEIRLAHAKAMAEINQPEPAAAE